MIGEVVGDEGVDGGGGVFWWGGGGVEFDDVV